MKTAVNKVLEDIPALKPQADGKTGFTQIGTRGNPAQHPQQTNNKSANSTDKTMEPLELNVSDSDTSEKERRYKIWH